MSPEERLEVEGWVKEQLDTLVGRVARRRGLAEGQLRLVALLVRDQALGSLAGCEALKAPVPLLQQMQVEAWVSQLARKVMEGMVGGADGASREGWAQGRRGGEGLTRSFGYSEVLTREEGVKAPLLARVNCGPRSATLLLADGSVAQPRRGGRGGLGLQVVRRRDSEARFTDSLR